MTKPLTRAEWLKYLDTTWKKCLHEAWDKEWNEMKKDSTTFDNWWATLTHKEQQMIGINNARFVWQQACEVCAQIADKAEPYKAADLIRATSRDLMPLFDDWGSIPHKKEQEKK